MCTGPRGPAGPSCVYVASLDWYPVMNGPLPFENPTDYWIVGYAADVESLSYNLEAYSVSQILYGPGESLNCLTDVSGGVPNFCQNVYNTTRKGVAPGQIALTPFTGAYKYSILRWLAPRAGLYNIASWFYAGDSGTTLASVHVNGDLIADLGNTPVNYTTQLFLDKWTIVDFVVGPGDEPTSDITPLDVRIEDVSCIGDTG